MSRRILFFILFSLQLAAIEVLTEARVGYFLPTDSQFRHVYGQDGIISGVEASFAAGRNFYPWASINYYGNSGHSSLGHKKTHIYFIPIGAGLKYIYFWDHLGVYGGIGALPTYLHIKNNSPLLLRTQEKWGCGGIAKVGFIADRLWNFFIDLFAEYSYIKIPFHNKHGRIAELNPANLSNFTIGGGVGYHFGGCPIECDDD